MKCGVLGRAAVTSERVTPLRIVVHLYCPEEQAGVISRLKMQQEPHHGEQQKRCTSAHAARLSIELE